MLRLYLRQNLLEIMDIVAAPDILRQRTTYTTGRNSVGIIVVIVIAKVLLSI